MKSLSAQQLKTGQVSIERDLTVRWARTLVLELLGRIRRGVVILEDGNDIQKFSGSEDLGIKARIVVNSPSFYREVIAGGITGAGESYMRGNWHSPDLLSLVRLMVLNMKMMEQVDSRPSLLKRALLRLSHLRNRNSLQGSRRNISAHYDLSNEFFATFLDKSMMYSAAVFHAESDDLYQASVNKLDHICRQLQLKPGDHLLEIGTGWGSLAIHAARHYGCRVTTTTLSEQQFAFASNRIAEEKLEQQVILLLKDYRDLQGKYDKLVSVEMIEAVGHEYYRDYFSQCSALLKQDGLMLIQAITISDQRYEKALKRVDFIQRFIFPGGCLPSNSVIASHVAEDTDMQIIGLQDITRDYARTLEHWRQQFLQQTEEISRQGFSAEFIRMWDYYLAYCQGGFMERVIHTAQILMAKPDFRALAPIRRLD